MKTTPSQFFSEFKTPQATYRPAPLFVLNDEFEPIQGEVRITKMLEAMQQAGYGGAYLHPRPGLITEYLSPRWFEIIRHSVRECLRLGMIPSLYDENSYPSGVGGGHVPSLAPETRTKYVAPVFGDNPRMLPVTVLSIYRMEKGLPTKKVLPAALKKGMKWMAFTSGEMPSMSWHGETAVPSLLDPQTTITFLKVTHDRYRQELGEELWSQVGAIFTDEPHLPAQGHGAVSSGLHLTPFLFGQFRLHYGYSLEDHLPELYYNVADYQSVRFDYYHLMHQLWVKHWALPLERWCRDHKIVLTGHYLEHDWPTPYSTPGQMHLLGHLDWPGTDLLETNALKGHANFDVQNFDRSVPGTEPHALMYQRQCASVANQYGKSRVMNESWGAGGNDSTPADWMRMGRWLIAHGVNHLVPHLTLMTNRGTRKADHPQTFSTHSSWFEWIKPLNDELARLSVVGSLGEVKNRVLLLDSQTSGFCHSEKSDCVDLPWEKLAAVKKTSGIDLAWFLKVRKSVISIQRDGNAWCQELVDRQIDFDLGDEYILEEIGSVDQSQLVIGQQHYQRVVIPQSMTNMISNTVDLLERYLENGGVIYEEKRKEIRVDGRKSLRVEQLRKRYQKNWIVFSSRAKLQAEIEAVASPLVKFSTPIAPGVSFLRRTYGEIETWMIVNSSPRRFESVMTIQSSKQFYYQLDPATGEVMSCGAEKIGNGVAIQLVLEASRSTVIVASDEASVGFNAKTKNIETTKLSTSSASVKLISVERQKENFCVIDSCSLEIEGKRSPSELVYAANKRYWKHHGMETNGWMYVVQYRDQLLARDTFFEEGTGGKVVYEFTVKGAKKIGEVQLGIELPALWAVSLNGVPLAFDLGSSWRDDHIHLAKVSLKEGRNVVVLESTRFTVRQEIDQIYVVGDFNSVPSTNGFSIEPAKPLMLGSWKSQGHPFYDQSVRYQFEVQNFDRLGRLTLPLGSWGGSLISVRQGEREIYRGYEAPFTCELDPKKGNRFSVEVVGLPKNLWGPWHDADQARGRAWGFLWYGETIPTKAQPGKKYDLMDLGLWKVPSVKFLG